MQSLTILKLKNRLPIIVLLEGFVTISLEILTIRQLMPVVGNNVIVTSLVIGVFLLFLSFGYQTGGNHNSDYQKILKRNFSLTAAGLGIGLSYIAIEILFSLFTQYITPSTWVPLIFYLMLVTAPLAYLLGQTVPIVLHLWDKSTNMGKTSGRVLYISTLGSFFGATLTTLLLLNYLGAAWTIFSNFILLAFLACLLLEKKPSDLIWIFLLMSCAPLIYGVNVALEKQLFVTTNNYGNYNITIKPEANDKEKYLIINDSTSSYLNREKKGLAYIELIKKIIFTDLNSQNKEILVLGAGGFTLSAEKTKENHFTYVDIDPTIKNIVQKHFLSQIKGNFIADDARHYLQITTKKYDIILSDTYSNRAIVPANLLTREYFQSINNALLNKGVAIFNIIANPMLSDDYSRHVDNTIRSIFPNCMSIPLLYSRQPTNIIYLCNKSSTEKKSVIYTDNLNRASWEFTH
jgi:spermidine synthase